MADPHLTPDRFVDLLAGDGHEVAVARDHVAGCTDCGDALARLEATARAAARAAPAGEPRAELRAATVAAVRVAAAAERTPAPAAPAPRTPRSLQRRRHRLLRRGPALGLAAVAAAAAVAIVVATVGDDAPEAVLEVRAALVRPGSQAQAGDLEVSRTGIGRLVDIKTSALPELDNDREFYEVWFVAPGDRPDVPDPVSAGTFHPDERGRSSVSLTAAVVPADYPVVSITREPRDGDPRRTGPEVLRTRG